MIGKDAGVFASESEVLTHYYVFSGVYSAVLQVNGNVYKIEGVSGRNKDKKLLRLKINKDDFKTAKFAETIREGQPVSVCLPQDDSVKGKIVSIEDRIKIEVESPVPNIRGLPVLNIDGEVVGIIEFFVRDKKYVYAIPALKDTPFEVMELLSIKDWKVKHNQEWLESGAGKRQTIMYLMGMNRYKEAAGMLEKIVEKAPEDKEARFKLGACYGRLGRYKDAARVYKEYINVAPDDLKAHYNLGITYLALGDIKAARGEYAALKRFRSKEAVNLAERLIVYIQHGAKP
jgi:hypothetical protein